MISYVAKMAKHFIRDTFLELSVLNWIFFAQGIHFSREFFHWKATDRKRLMDRTSFRCPKEIAAAESNVSHQAKGVLASKTNSYPQSPLSAVFFADNLLLAAWFTAPLRGSEKERNKKKKGGTEPKEKNYFWEALIFIVLHTYVATSIILR